MSQRLYVAADLAHGGIVPLDESQAHYVRAVLRLEAGADILVFNGRDGEWHAVLDSVSKKAVVLRLETQTRPQDDIGDIWLLVAPVKKERFDYLAQKATEMGVGRLMPIMTKRTQGIRGGRIKMDRLVANTIEAAEQCNIMSVPHVSEPQKLEALLADWPTDRRIIFCDSEAEAGAGIASLDALKGEKLAILIGPEGGFDDDERTRLCARADTLAISLGPRILRTDTAVVAALALVQSRLGDWCDWVRPLS